MTLKRLGFFWLSLEILTFAAPTLARCDDLAQNYLAERSKAYSQYKEMMSQNPNITEPERARRAHEIFASSQEAYYKLEANVQSKITAAVIKGAYSRPKPTDAPTTDLKAEPLAEKSRAGSSRSSSSSSRAADSNAKRIGSTSGDVEAAGAKRVSFQKSRAPASQSGEDASAGAKAVSFSSSEAKEAVKGSEAGAAPVTSFLKDVTNDE